MKLQLYLLDCGRADGFAYGIEDTVNEWDGVFLGVAAGEFEGFVDDNGGRRAKFLHLENRHS